MASTSSSKDYRYAPFFGEADELMTRLETVTGTSDLVCGEPPLTLFTTVEPSDGLLCTPTSILRFRIDRGDFLYSALQFDGYAGGYTGWAAWTDSVLSNHSYVTTLESCGLLRMIRGFRNMKIDKNNDALICLISRWSCSNNTFLSAWGEIGITVEDVCQLLGLEPLAAVDLTKDPSAEVEDIMDHLRAWYTSAARYVGLSGKHPGKSSFVQWQRYCFEDRDGDNALGGPVSHHKHHLAAFILAFISRFIAPGRAADCPRLLLIRVAAELSLGRRIAIAQLMLGNLYHQLSIVHEALAHSNGRFDVGSFLPIPFVMSFLYERFPAFAPDALVVESTGNFLPLRIERWNNQSTTEKLTSYIDREEYFNFRPYNGDRTSHQYPFFHFT